MKGDCGMELGWAHARMRIPGRRVGIPFHGWKEARWCIYMCIYMVHIYVHMHVPVRVGIPFHGWKEATSELKGSLLPVPCCVHPPFHGWKEATSELNGSA